MAAPPFVLIAAAPRLSLAPLPRASAHRSSPIAEIEMLVALKGTCYLRVEGTARRVDAGDVLLLRGFTTDPDAGQSGAEILVVRYDGLAHPPWVAALPPLAHLRTASRSETASYLVDLVRAEIARKGPASQLLLSRLADALLVAVARACLPPGFEFERAAVDARIARTLAALHERLSDRWTIAKMAKIAGMSRAAFARRFKQVTGAAPGVYLVRLRIDAAKKLLADTDEPAATIAFEIGYESAYAFSRAFKRIVGRPPVVFRRAMRAAPARIVCRGATLALAA
jgi:AraC-like DNA-binding protein